MNRENRSHPAGEDGMQDEIEYDDPWPGRLPSSSRRYDRLPSVPAQDRTIITMHPNKPVPRSAIPARRSAQTAASRDRKSTRLNSSHYSRSRMPSSA